VNRSQRAEAAVIGLSASFALVGGFASFFMPVFLRDSLGFSGLAIGLLYGALSLTSLACALPVGAANDRLGSRPPLLASVLAAGVAVAGMGLSRSLWLYLPLYVLYGLASNVFRISADSLFLRDENDARRFGLYSAARLAGIGLGTLACGLVVARLDFPRTLLALSGFTLALCLWAPALPRGGGCATRLSGYGQEFLGQPGALFFAGWLFLYTTHWGAEYTSYGLFLRHGLNLSLTGMGLFMTGQFAVIATAAWGAGRLLKAGARAERLLALGLLLSGVGAVVMVTPQLAVSFAFRAVHEVGDGLLTVIMYVRLKELFGSRRIGGHVGLVQVVTTLGALCGSLIFGPLGTRYGYWLPLAASGMITLCLLPLLAVGERRFAATGCAGRRAIALAAGGSAAGSVARAGGRGGWRHP